METQQRRHKGPLIGMALVVIFALTLLFWLGMRTFELSDPPQGETTQIDGRTGEPVEPAVIEPGPTVPPVGDPLPPADDSVPPVGDPLPLPGDTTPPGPDLPPVEVPSPGPDLPPTPIPENG